MGVHCTLDVDGTWIAVGCGMILGRYKTYEEYKEDRPRLEQRCREIGIARGVFIEMGLGIGQGCDTFILS